MKTLNSELTNLFEFYIMDHIDEDIVMIPLDWVVRQSGYKYSRNDIIFTFFMYFYNIGCDVFMDINERYLIYAL